MTDLALCRRCCRCHREFKLSATHVCDCGAPFRYKVVVRNAQGKKVTKTCDSLSLARSIEAKFKTSRIQEEVFGLKPTAITLGEAWLKYLPWATTHKKSWKADQSRWTHHIEPHLASKRMDRITPGDVQALIDRLP